MTNLRPVGLYLHFPWCIQKCPYCDFNSHTLTDSATVSGSTSTENAYLAALVRDIEYAASQHGRRRVNSIFIGGGTPSLFSGAAIATTLQLLSKHFAISADAEITLEANPGTVDSDHFRGYRDAGVNRLSIGVQSLDDASLKRLGRIHDSQQARNAIVVARKAGFDNINLDMMYALPQQSIDAAKRDLSELLTLAPDHVSYYQLTLEPGTRFALRPPLLPDTDDAWRMQEQAIKQLAAAGFQQYEISAYAGRGGPSQHNLNYWKFGDYIGIGAGAHGKITLDDNTLRRESRISSPGRYMTAAGAESSLNILSIKGREITLEFLLNALRLNEGFTREEYQRNTGRDDAELNTALATSFERQLVEEANQGIRCTPLGSAHLNTVLEMVAESLASDGV